MAIPPTSPKKQERHSIDFQSLEFRPNSPSSPDSQERSISRASLNERVGSLFRETKTPDPSAE